MEYFQFTSNPINTHKTDNLILYGTFLLETFIEKLFGRICDLFYQQ
jgi:hypothetical protein